MSGKERTITLSIREAGTPPERSFVYQVLVDGEVVAPNLSLSPEQARAVRELSRQHSALFEQRRAPKKDAGELQALGARLFDLWLREAWEKVTAKVPVGAQRVLVIASDVPDVLNLPWELLRPPDGDFLGFDPRFCIRRLPWPDRPLAPFDGQLPPRPLRILFMACSPIDQAPLDHDREEESLFKAIASAGPNVALDVGDLGTFDELRQRINEFKPHVVHLTGHGVVKDDGLGYFAFEDERGLTDLRSSEEMCQQLFGGSGVQCVFVSGCQTGKAPPVAALGGVCQGLVRYEVPLAIGWAASISDISATQFATVFYDTLARGRPVDRALTQARQAIGKGQEQRSDPSWTLPVLYSSTTQGPVFDADSSRPPAPPPRPTVVQQPLPGMTEGYAEHFVGRRRELQRLLPALREAALQTVLITGLGGAGKSTLATRLARRLEADGFTPIPVPSSRDTPLSVALLLEKCGDAFLRAGLKTEHGTLNDGDIAVEDRLRYVVTVLNAGRFVLVVDNFEVNLEDTTRRILDQSLAGFYTHLLANLAGGSRAIVTCRYRPADVESLPRTAHEEPLGDFPEASFLKFLLRDEEVERRYYGGELPPDLLRELHRLLGGTPRFLEQMRSLLRTMAPDELERELAAVKLPDTGEPSVLAEARDAYCEEIITARLYGYLSPESRRALSRAAVYNVPVNLEGLAAVTGEPVERLRDLTREWQDYALAYPERERALTELWTVYGLLRGWLLAPERLSTEERRAAHGAAGDFLRQLVEDNRTAQLALHPLEADLEARAQYLPAGRHDEARAVTSRLSGNLTLAAVYDEVLRLNEELLKHREHPGPMSWIARAYHEQAEYRRAREWYERCLAAAGDAVLHEAATAWHGLATIDVEQGHYEAAREKFKKALHIEQQIGDQVGEAASWQGLASMHLEQGDYNSAREGLQRALAIARELGLSAAEASSLHELARIDSREDDYVAARQKCVVALQISRQRGHRVGEAASLHLLAFIDSREGDDRGSAQKLRQSLQIHQKIRDKRGEGAAWLSLGGLAAQVGQLTEGARLVALSFVILQSIGHADTEKARESLTGMASDLKYSQERFHEMLKEVAEAYQRDQGHGLLKAAFPED